MKHSVRRVSAAVAVFFLLLAVSGSFCTVRAAFSGSYKTEDAYTALTVGGTVEFAYLQGVGGYTEEKQNIWAIREDGTVVQSWYERVLGSSDGVPYFCIEQNSAYVAERTATVYDGLKYMGQEEITRIALALKYLEDHIQEIDGNKSDLYFLQQLAIWKIRDEAGYHAYGEQSMDYAAARLESKEEGEASAEFSVDIVRRAIAWADANAGRYTGYSKVLDSGEFQRCAVFMAVENPAVFSLPETGSAGTLLAVAAGGIFILVSAAAGAFRKEKDSYAKKNF